MPAVELRKQSALGLLRRVGDGHLALCSEDVTTIYPVDYRVSGDLIVFRLAPGSLLQLLRRRRAIALEVDRHDARKVWSVVASGMSRIASSEAEIDRFDRLSWPGWAASSAYTYVVLEIGDVTGRRIERRPASDFSFLGL